MYPARVISQSFLLGAPKTMTAREDWTLNDEGTLVTAVSTIA